MAASIQQRHEKSDFTVFFSYVGIQQGDGSVVDEPCMCLGRHHLGRKVAWVIPLSVASRYADDKTGAPTPYLISAAASIAEMFGMGVNRWDVKKIADAIVDHLPDLVRMPPAPWKTTSEIVENAVEHHGLKLSVNGDQLLQ